jgi:chromate reductase
MFLNTKPTSDKNPPTMNISILSGSARSQNNTYRVALALQKQFDEYGHDTTLVDFTYYDLPLIHQGDINPQALTLFQQNLISSIEQANLCIIVTPEYNWTTTPEILNMVHRLADKNFKHIFNNKVFAFVGVSSGKGGKMPAVQLVSVFNKIISFMGLFSISSPKILEAHFVKEVLDEKGNSLGNALFDKGLEDFVQYNLYIANRWKA